MGIRGKFLGERKPLCFFWCSRQQQQQCRHVSEWCVHTTCCENGLQHSNELWRQIGGFPPQARQIQQLRYPASQQNTFQVHARYCEWPHQVCLAFQHVLLLI